MNLPPLVIAFALVYATLSHEPSCSPVASSTAQGTPSARPAPASTAAPIGAPLVEAVEAPAAASAPSPTDAVALCDPRLPPFRPCCDRAKAASWGKPVEPRPYASLHELLLELWCKPGASAKGAANECWTREAKCQGAPGTANTCIACSVFVAGAGHGHPAVWTGHHLDEVDGPWSPDGKTAVR